MMTFHCEFDHMYTTFTEPKALNEKCNEVKHLKELLLMHLDLIQQQCDELNLKNKEIQFLKLENENLKQYLTKLEKNTHFQVNSNSTLLNSVLNNIPKNECCDERKSGTSNKITTEADTSDSAIISEKSEFETLWQITNHVSHNRRKLLFPFEKKDSSVESNKTATKISCDSSSETVNKLTTDLIISKGATKLSISNKKKHYLNADNEKYAKISSSDYVTSSLFKQTLFKKGQPLNKKIVKGDPCLRKVNIMTTDKPYYISSIVFSDLNSMNLNPNNDIEIPKWKIRQYGNLYAMEGTENLDDELFFRRHQKFESDEKRRKRWDMQQYREQKHCEKLKQRYKEKFGKCNEEILKTFNADPFKAKYLQIDNYIPVSVFGCSVPLIPYKAFTLPWSDSHAKSSQRNPKSKRVQKEKKKRI